VEKADFGLRLRNEQTFQLFRAGLNPVAAKHSIAITARLLSCAMRVPARATDGEGTSPTIAPEQGRFLFRQSSSNLTTGGDARCREKKS
jgi:hypothetical protein